MGNSSNAELKRLRERAGLTIEEAAAAAGYSERQIRRYKNGLPTNYLQIFLKAASPLSSSIRSFVYAAANDRSPPIFTIR